MAEEQGLARRVPKTCSQLVATRPLCASDPVSLTDGEQPMSLPSRADVDCVQRWPRKALEMINSMYSLS